ncbi:MAG: diphosphomevalonate decarboxylase [Pseudomonadota bacterium]
MATIHGNGSAPPNIALVKYWGKRDPDRNLPFTDTFAVVLDQGRTRVNVGEWAEDGIWWQFGGQSRRLSSSLSSPYIRMLDYVRAIHGVDRPLRVVVAPSLPPRIGFAGSAAAMAALASALEDAFGLDLDLWERSALARIGSGSAARSIPDGFVRWYAGDAPDGGDSYAECAFPPEHWEELRLILVPADPTSKDVPSTRAMLRCQETSPLFRGWLSQCREDLPPVLAAVALRDIEALGRVAESNARLMHAVALTADPPILYWSRDTIRIFEAMAALRQGGTGVWCTVDAGPNPILITLDGDVERVTQVVRDVLPGVEPIVARPGLGAVSGLG